MNVHHQPPVSDKSLGKLKSSFPTSSTAGSGTHSKKSLKKTNVLADVDSKLSFWFGVTVSSVLWLAVILILVLVFVVKTRSVGSAGSQAFDTQPAGGEVADRGAPETPAEINIPAISASDHIRGSKSASLVLYEYSDVDCPFCGRFHDTMKQAVAEYGKEIAWVYRHFPLDSLHPEARLKAEATECVAEQAGETAFWKFLDTLLGSPGKYKAADLGALAAEQGLDKSKLEKCLEKGTYKELVVTQVQDAVSSGGRGTPFNVIVTRNGEKIPLAGAVPFEQLKAAIEGLQAE